MAALGWPLLAVGRDVDLAGLCSRPPDGEDVPDGNVWVQGIREGGHRGGGDLVVFQEELKGTLQAVDEAEQGGGERVEVGWMSHHLQQASHGQRWLSTISTVLAKVAGQWWLSTVAKIAGQ